MGDKPVPGIIAIANAMAGLTRKGKDMPRPMTPQEVLEIIYDVSDAKTGNDKIPMALTPLEWEKLVVLSAKGDRDGFRDLLKRIIEAGKRAEN
jgi:hypothetical protein